MVARRRSDGECGGPERVGGASGALLCLGPWDGASSRREAIYDDPGETRHSNDRRGTGRRGLKARPAGGMTSAAGLVKKRSTAAQQIESAQAVRTLPHSLRFFSVSSRVPMSQLGPVPLARVPGATVPSPRST